MTQDALNPKHWTADEGKYFQTKGSNFLMGNELFLGGADSIENYIEVDKPKDDEFIYPDGEATSEQ